MSQNNVFVSDDFQYTPSSNITTLQNVYVPQSDSIVTLIMELRNEIALLKTEVIGLKREVNELKEGNKRHFLKLTEEVISVKLEGRKHYGENIMVEELNDTQKLPFNKITDLDTFDALVQENEDKLKQFKECIAKPGGEGPATFLRAAIRKLFSDELATLYSSLLQLKEDICHLKYKSTDKDMNLVLQKHFVHAKDRVTKRKRKD